MKAVLDVEGLAAEVRAKRARLQLDQADVARICGVNTSTISRIENWSTEKPDPRLLLMLCHWLEQPLSRFLYLEKELVTV
jgi:transcriptional regulator with XRE-family HTH domain